MLFKKRVVVWLVLSAIVIANVNAISNPAGYSTKWVILKECSVKVNGSTNINTFTCTVVGYTKNDTITCYTGNSDKNMVSMKGHMVLPVFNFDCANKVMTKDLRKTLKEKEYPTFLIHFISMERYPQLKSVPEFVGGIVSIEMAGVKKQLAINYNLSMDDEGIVEMTGAQTIYFSDFNLAAPRKMGGIIKASNKLEVEFTIHCRVIAPTD